MMVSRAIGLIPPNIGRCLRARWERNIPRRRGSLLSHTSRRRPSHARALHLAIRLVIRVGRRTPSTRPAGHGDLGRSGFGLPGVRRDHRGIGARRRWGRHPVGTVLATVRSWAAPVGRLAAASCLVLVEWIGGGACPGAREGNARFG